MEHARFFTPTLFYMDQMFTEKSFENPSASVVIRFIIGFRIYFIYFVIFEAPDFVFQIS